MHAWGWCIELGWRLPLWAYVHVHLAAASSHLAQMTLRVTPQGPAVIQKCTHSTQKPPYTTQLYGAADMQYTYTLPHESRKHTRWKVQSIKCTGCHGQHYDYTINTCTITVRFKHPLPMATGRMAICILALHSATSTYFWIAIELLHRFRTTTI